MRLIFAATAALCFATASNAAIIEYSYDTGKIPVSWGARYLETLDGAVLYERITENFPAEHQSNSFKTYLKIDTSKVQSEYISFYTDGMGNPILSEGVLEVPTGVKSSYFSMRFSPNWDIWDYDLDLENDGYSVHASPRHASINQFAVRQDQYGWYGPAGFWKMVIIERDVVAPVPLPAAGGLLLAALAGLGMVKHRKKSA